MLVLLAGYFSLAAAPDCRDGTACGGTGQWVEWPNAPPTSTYSNPGTIPFPKSKSLIGWEFKSGSNPGYGSGNTLDGSADTWYPTWAADGNLYTPWTDGSVHDDAAAIKMADNYTVLSGALVAGGDIGVLNTTWVGAMAHCNTTVGCLGFTFEAGASNQQPTKIVKVYFKEGKINVNGDAGWTSWLKGKHANGEISSGSGGRPKLGWSSTTGQAKIVGDDPFNLTITEVKTFASSTYPYQGRYPCGSLVYKGTWWYGTYYLDNPNVTVGNTYSGPNPGPNCGNWCVQGPVVNFRHSTDYGKTWHEERMNATNASDNLFGESAANNSKVKFGAPHWVDFGQEMEHSPDGKAYLVGHGATRPEAIQAWMLGDEIYMARVVPTIANIADKSNWEFYAGGHGSDAKWVKGDVVKAAPLVEWANHTGVVTMTYMAAIKKYVLTISTATVYPMMTHEFDTYFLESDSITGPWHYVTYMSKFGPEAYFVNHPSKFMAKAADTQARTYDTFLMYSANFAFKNGSNPPNSGYHMNLQQARFKLSASFAAHLEEVENVEEGGEEEKRQEDKDTTQLISSVGVPTQL